MKTKKTIILTIVLLGIIVIFSTTCEMIDPEIAMGDSNLAQFETIELTNIKDTTVSCKGLITNQGYSTVTERGFCWSTSTNPTILDNYITSYYGPGPFTCVLTGLSARTTYTVRAYATNTLGTNYSNQISFTINGVTDYDGNNYPTVIIGKQEWMAKNLKVAHYPNGDVIPLVIDDNVWENLGDNDIDDAYCYYNNYVFDFDAYEALDNYGALYTYAAAIGDNWERDNVDGQGICPDGWHLPTNTEWDELKDYLGEWEVVGGKLKETETTHWDSPNEGATNEIGFTALPGGYRDYDNGSFEGLGANGNWWSVAVNSGENSCYRKLNYNEASILNYQANFGKSYGFSVRCVKD